MGEIGSVASIIAVIQLTAAVTNICYEYIKAMIGAPRDIKAIVNETRSLESVLLQLQDLDSTPDNANSTQLLQWAKGIGGPLDRCFVELGVVEEVLRSASATDNGIRRALWPFKQKGILQSMKIIRREKETLSLALAGDTAAMVRSAKAGVEALQVAQNAQHRENILKWLMATNPQIYHEAARKEHEPKTGEWFLDGDVFKKWKCGKESEGGTRPFVWLHGIPGCGKSILCSSIIEATMSYCTSRPAHALAYFYFDFNDEKKEQTTNLLSALVAQLCPEEIEIPSVVERLYDTHSCYSTRPTLEELVRTLRELSELHERIFLIIDALDECTKREELLILLREIFGWKEGKFTILVASRRERDIELALKTVVSESICVQSSDIGGDIQKFVRSRLSDDLRLQTWSEAAKAEIENALVERADGICVTRSQLRKALRSLPKTLPDTYDRILMSIDENHREIALTVLRWLAYSGVRLTLEEVAEASAVRIGCFEVDPDERLRDPREILAICSTLITETPFTYSSGISTSMLRLAHYSVKEYLISDGIKNSKASYFSLDEDSANRNISETCLTYLLSFKSAQQTNLARFWDQFPLYRYASKFWAYHARKCAGSANLTSWSLSFLKDEGNEGCRLNWLRVHRPDIPYDSFREPDPWSKSPLYYASCLGLLDTAKALLEDGADVNGDISRGEFPLMAAVNRERAELVELLLKNGANVQIWSSDHYVPRAGRAWVGWDSTEGTHVTPLHVAAATGQQKIVSLLLDKGADINAADCPDSKFKSVYGAPLTHAARTNSLDVVKLLLEKGAEVTQSQGRYGHPLQQATYRGRPEVVQLLLEKGADVNDDGDEYGNALCATISAGYHKKISQMVRVLLGHGADPNADVRGYPGRALYLASKRNLLDVMRMLLDAGANIDALGGENGTALAATAWDFGNTEAMRLLLDRGANVNAVVTANGGTALGAAIAIGDEESIRLLLDFGADLAKVTYGRPGMTELLIAVRCCAFSSPALEQLARNAETDLRMLLRPGAREVNALENNGKLERALIAAAIAKSGKAMEVLLEEANGFTNGRYQKTLEHALVEAAHAGSLAVATILLDKGVSPDSRYEGESALQAAWKYNFEGHNAVADELLRRGAKLEWPFTWKKGTRWVELSRWAEKALEPDGLS